MFSGEYFFLFEVWFLEDNFFIIFEGKYGYVKYWFKVIFDWLWKDEIKIVELFIVMERIDVN